MVGYLGTQSIYRFNQAMNSFQKSQQNEKGCEFFTIDLDQARLHDN